MANILHNNLKISTQEGRRRYNLGKEAELIAMSHLQQQGYKIICQRYRCAYGEIDIIACKDGTITFVEVKARNSPIADDLVLPKQLQRIFDAATFFLANHPAFDKYQCRVDIIVISKNKVSQHIQGQSLD